MTPLVVLSEQTRPTLAGASEMTKRANFLRFQFLVRQTACMTAMISDAMALAQNRRTKEDGANLSFEIPAKEVNSTGIISLPLSWFNANLMVTTSFDMPAKRVTFARGAIPSIPPNGFASLPSAGAPGPSAGNVLFRLVSVPPVRFSSSIQCALRKR